MGEFSGLSSWFLTAFACIATFILKENNSPDLKLYTFPDITLNDTYDFIIIGAGSAGSVVANRLSEIKDWKILLVEAGGEEDVISDTPMLATTLWDTDKDWNYSTVEQKHACRDTDGICKYPRGHVLGGSSTLNFMNYVRGNKWDFDNWKNQDNEDWGYEDVLPYFLKSEDMKIKDLAKDLKYHSTGGPLTIEKSRYESSLTEDFIKAGIELGFPMKDYNGETQTSIFYPQYTMRKGTRCSTSKAYLSTIKNQKNIHISKRTLALKIGLNKDNTRAMNVVLLKNGKIITIKATKEIIISAGAIDTPKLLMLSGIGPKEDLKQVGITTFVDLPVGNNLVDHSYILHLFSLNKNVTITKKMVENIDTILEYANNKTGPIASMLGLEAVGHFTLDRSNNDLPDVQVFLVSFASFSFNKPVIMITTTKLRPQSVGTVRLKSSNPSENPLIDPRFLEHPSDYEDSVKGCLLILDYIKTESMAKYHPKIFAEGTVCNDKDNEDYCRCAVTHFSRTMFHPTGTAKMSKDGVVTSKLNVWGISNLRVADASIMPNITSGNTNAPTIMIGEKAADIIKKHWNMI